MRKINTGDVFKMARLLKKGDVVSTIKDAYAAGKEKDADSEKIGMDAILKIFCSCTDQSTEGQIYDLLGGICEKTSQEIQNQSLEATIEDVKRIVKENNIANFLKSASGLVGKM